MNIASLTLDFIEIPLRAPFETSFGVETVKSCWLLTVESDGVRGYAETVADVEPLYGPETHATVYYALKNHLWPRLQSLDINDPQAIWQAFGAIRGNNMAKAGLEMAIWDWYARSQKQPLYALLGGDPRRTEVPVGVSIGIQPNDMALIDMAQAYWQKGYQRLKIKIRPGRDIGPLQALRRAMGPDVPIMADANSAYQLQDAQGIAQWDDLSLMMIEQPLGATDIIDHATLAQSLRTPICLDESIESDDDARVAIKIGAAAIMNIKLGRVGGHQMARRIHDLAYAKGVPVWCGGMLETGIGRAHNLHMTTLPGFTLPGDTSASDRYFYEDLIDPPFELSDRGTLRVPSGDGIGVEPDPVRLKKFSQYHETWRGGKTSAKGGVPHGGQGARF